MNPAVYDETSKPLHLFIFEANSLVYTNINVYEINVRYSDLLKKYFRD